MPIARSGIGVEMTVPLVCGNHRVASDRSFAFLCTPGRQGVVIQRSPTSISLPPTQGMGATPAPNHWERSPWVIYSDHGTAVLIARPYIS